MHSLKTDIFCRLNRCVLFPLLLSCLYITGRTQGRLTHLLRRRSSHTDRHFVSTASCVKTTLALPTKKLGCHEIETNISSAYENYAIFSRRKLLIIIEILHIEMEVTVPNLNAMKLKRIFQVPMGTRPFSAGVSL